MIKKHLQKFINTLLPKTEINKEVLEKLTKNRNFLDKKRDIFSLLPYKNKTVREAILELKFKNNTAVAKIFGEILFDNITEYLEDLKIQENFYDPVIITVPVSFLRKIKRGYNQNDLIIQEFMEVGGNNFLKWEKDVLKKKHRKPQSRTNNKAERLKNQKNAYKILKPEKIKNKNIILFDDIYTTGATINEIKKSLKKDGVKKIKTIIIAH